MDTDERQWAGQTRRRVAGILLLFIVPGMSFIGFFTPDSIVMFQEGGYDLWREVWFEWNRIGFEAWVSIWWAFLGGCLGFILGALLWYTGVIMSGLLTPKEMEEFEETRNREGLFAAMRGESSGDTDNVQ